MSAVSGCESVTRLAMFSHHFAIFSSRCPVAGLGSKSGLKTLPKSCSAGYRLRTAFNLIQILNKVVKTCYQIEGQRSAGSLQQYPSDSDDESDLSAMI